MELVLFYIAAAVAVAGAALVVTRLNASHALIYLVVSLLAIAVMFYLLGAPFAAALEVVIYAGAIVVLFLFVVMMLNLGRRTVERERRWLEPRAWIGPGVLAAILFFEMMYAIVGNTATTGPDTVGTEAVGPKAVGTALFREYLLAVELAAILLLAALVGAYHLGRRYLSDRREEPSAGEREGPAPRMNEPSAGEREGRAPRMQEPSA